MNKPHIIKFRKEIMVVVETKKNLKEVDKVVKDVIMEVLIYPSVQQNAKGRYIEMANLELVNGDILKDVPYSSFEFIYQ